MIKVTRLLVFVGIFSIFLLGACSSEKEEPTPQPTETPAPITFSISGSGSMTPVLAAIADDFHQTNPGYRLEVLSGSGTGDGVRGTIEGVLDLAAMSRTAREAETEAGIQFVQIGSSFTTVFINPGIGITELTSEQLTDIFSGEIVNWSEVGGPDLEILVYVRDPEEGNTIDIREMYIGDVEFVESAQLMNSQNDMQDVVASVEGAIGYGTWAAAVANNAEVTDISIDGIGVENTPVERYGLFGIGYLESRQEEIQPLIDWFLSENGQAALQNVGVIPLQQ